MIADLEHLIRLQQLDDFVAGARRALAEHPDHIKALDDRLSGANARLADARQRAADSQASRRTLDKDLSAVQGRLSKFKDQLMEVKTNREYQAMQKEIETGQHDLRRTEDKILEQMLDADDIAAAVKQAGADLAAEQAAIDTERRKMEQEAAEIEQQLNSALAARAEVVAALSPAALALFEQVARNRRGIAVAEAKGGLCGACHVRLRPQRFNEIRRNEAIIQCESCQRVLYFAGSAESAEQAH
jgi:predicted  nucleic acid-binding Zn-ribbon protein